MSAIAQLLLASSPPIDATVTYSTHLNSNAGTSSYTFTAASIGTAGGSRRVVIAVNCRIGSGTATAITAVSVAAIAATRAITKANATGDLSEIWIASVPTGTTGDVVVTLNGTTLRLGIGIWATYNVLSATPIFTVTSNASPAVLTANVQGGGIAIATGFNIVDAPNNATWANLTEKYDDIIVDANTMTGASDAFATIQTGLAITITWGSSSNPCACLAAFR